MLTQTAVKLSSDSEVNIHWETWREATDFCWDLKLNTVHSGSRELECLKENLLSRIFHISWRWSDRKRHVDEQRQSVFFIFRFPVREQRLTVTSQQTFSPVLVERTKKTAWKSHCRPGFWPLPRPSGSEHFHKAPVTQRQAFQQKTFQKKLNIWLYTELASYINRSKVNLISNCSLVF